MQRKTIIIIAAVILVLFLILGSYWAYRYNTQVAKETGDEENAFSLEEFIETDSKKIADEEPEGVKEEKRLTLAADQEIIGYWVNKLTGDLFLVNLAGEIIRGEEKISTQKINEIHAVRESIDGVKALFDFGYPQKEIFAIFDTSSNSWSPLPNGTIAADWHPNNSNEVIYLQNKEIKVFDLKGSNSRSLLKIDLLDVEFDWINESSLLIKERPTGLLENNIWLLNLKDKILTKYFSGSGLFLENFSDWEFIYYKEAGLILKNLLTKTVLNVKSRAIFGLQSLTIPEKCVFAGNNRFYCAVPEDLPTTIIFPDDYLKKEFYSSDFIYSLDINSEDRLIKTELINLNNEAPVDVSELKLIKDKLYFINRRDNKLYSLDIR